MHYGPLPTVWLSLKLIIVFLFFILYFIFYKSIINKEAERRIYTNNRETFIFTVFF